jgi:hypothetical protein
MKRTLLAIALLAPLIAFAQPRAIAMLGAHHADEYTNCRGTVAELNSATPGLGIGYDINRSSMVAAGIWRTSQDNWAPFAFADWRPLRSGNVSAGLFAGVSGGYCMYENRLGPFAGLTARVDIERAALHLLYVPSFGSEKNTAAVGLAVSHQF